MTAIFDVGVHIPTLAGDPSGAGAVRYSRQTDDVGQSASLRHIVAQKYWLEKSAVAMQSESFAQRIPDAGLAEQGAPNESAPAVGTAQSSWKASPVGTAGPTTQTRPPLQIESAPDCPYPGGLRASAFCVASVPQKLMGQTPPPIASAGQ